MKRRRRISPNIPECPIARVDTRSFQSRFRDFSTLYARYKSHANRSDRQFGINLSEVSTERSSLIVFLEGNSSSVDFNATSRCHIF